MEKKIENIIGSFMVDFDPKRLELLDNILFSLLLKREISLIENKPDKQSEKIGRLLDYYFDYRGLIYGRLKNRTKNRRLLIKKIYLPPDRLIFLITHNCQLKCKYCRVSKFPATMDEKTLTKAIDLLFTSNSQELQLQFFGGEPLLKFDLIKKAVSYAENLNRKYGRDIVFILTTNGIELSRDKVDFLRKHNFFVEFSIDGEAENQMRTRLGRNGKNYYRQMLNNFNYLSREGVPHYSISVFMPENISTMSENFIHLAKTGFKKLQINYSLGFFWDKKAISRLFSETDKILSFLKTRKDVKFINLTNARREPVVLNAELTVDCDGGIYLESGICLEEDFFKMKNKFLLTSVGEAQDINFYHSTRFQNFYRLSKVYAQENPLFRKIILNNIFLGSNYGRFLNSASGKRKNQEAIHA